MVEKIEMQKGLIPVFSANRVKHVKRQNGSMHKKRFHRDLKEEKDKKKHQTDNTSVFLETEDATGQTKNTPEADYSIDQRPKLKNKAVDDAQGKLIDIVV